MPDDAVSSETRTRCDRQDARLAQLESSGLPKELEAALGRFDWHSQVTIYFAQGEGGAGWIRSKRTITIHSEYVRRFNKQGAISKRRSARSGEGEAGGSHKDR